MATLEGTLEIARDVKPGEHCRGRAAITYVTAEEDQAIRERRAPMTVWAAIYERHVSAGDVDLCQPGTTAPFRIQVPRGPVKLQAILDVDHRFTRALFREDVEGTRQGETTDMVTAGGAPVRVTLDRIQKAPEPGALCKEPRHHWFTITAPEVAGRVGNPVERAFCVVLPESYEKDTQKRYPVVFLLPGLTGIENVRMGKVDVAGISAALAREDGLPEAIYVGVDGSNRFGSTYFVDSPTTGNWDAWSVRMVKEIDARFRTLATRGSRAVHGQSTGGFNAVKVAFSHPDLFGVVAASSPDPLDLDVGLLAGNGKLQKNWIAWMRVEDAMGADGQMSSWAGDWSPDDSARGFAWPASLEDGTPVPAQWKRWQDQSPTTWLKQPDRVKALMPLSNHVLLWVGSADDFGLHPPTVAFSEHLLEAGIRHELRVDDGGHGLSRDRFREQIRWMLTQFKEVAAP